MARTTTKIKFLGAADRNYSLDIMLDYPRRFIRHTFSTPGELLDVTALASADELNRNALFQAKLDDGTLQLVVSAGSQDVGAVSATQIAPETGGVGLMVAQRILLTAGTPGAPDDVTAILPFKCRLMRTLFICHDAIGGKSVQMRDTTGGAGNPASGTLSANATGPVGESGTTPTASVTFAAGATIYARRSDAGVGGELFLLLMREP